MESAILIERDYKGEYERFALTPDEFLNFFKGHLTDMPEPDQEGNTYTLAPLVHVWYRTAEVGDSAWTRFFTDMEDGLPQSDIDSGNIAYIRDDFMQSLKKYLYKEPKLYMGIELEKPKGRVSLTHSISMDAITGKSGTENMDWTEKLGELPWGALKESYFESYEKACKLFSMIHMDYQICNGGIGQYFFNGYHEARTPFSEDDVELYGIDVQKQVFSDLFHFTQVIYPERLQDNVSAQL